MDRNQKKELVANLAKTLGETQVVVITRNHGLTVAQVSDLRTRMRGAGAQFKVTKNRLARIALEGTPYQDIGQMLVGPVGLATSADPVAAAKIAIEFAKHLNVLANITLKRENANKFSRQLPAALRQTVRSWQVFDVDADHCLAESA